MGSSTIQATLSSAVAAGSKSPSRVNSPTVLRGSAGVSLLGGQLANALASDIESLSGNINATNSNLQSPATLSQLTLVNSAGQLTAAFGEVAYQGVYYTNYLSEIHVGNPLQTNDPSKALFNANPDGSVTIGQNGWLDVLDPYGGNAAWIGTQFDSTAITNAVNNGSGAIRITSPGHTLINGSSAQVRNMSLVNVPNANGTWTVTKIDASTVDLQGSTWSGPFIPIAAATGATSAALPPTRPSIDRVLQITNAVNNAGLIRITTSIPHLYESGAQVNIPAPGPLSGGAQTGAGQWIIANAAGSAFDLVGSTFAGTYAGGATVLQYFAGMLAETIAIGPSFQDYRLRAFASGDLRIRNATIELSDTAGGGEITLDPLTGQIVLTAASGAEIILDATVPSITLYNPSHSSALVTINSAGLSTNALKVNGTVIPGGGFSGPITGITNTSTITVAGGLITAFAP